MGLLDSRRAVVTGGGSGIGRATCRRMTDEGARVAVVDINGDAAEQVAKEIDGLAYTVDVTDYDALSAAVDDAAVKVDGLSTVVNNAGASNLSQVHEWPVDEWDRIVRLNLGGVFPWHQGDRAVPAGGGRGQHREHRVDQRNPPPRRRGPLLGGEGGGPGAHRGHGP